MAVNGGVAATTSPPAERVGGGGTGTGTGPGTGTGTGATGGGGGRERVFHTVTACVRCRQRKTRCDPALPRCEPCERANASCVYFDSTKNAPISRTYITSLQDKLRKLNAELKALDIDDHDEVDHESMAKSVGLVKFSEHDDSRFLGPSSGIAVTRFVMDFARKNSTGKTIRDIVPDHQAQEIKQKFDDEGAKPTSKVYPYVSSVPAPHLPQRFLMEKLVDIYMVKAQYMLPLLHEPTFRHDVDLVYDGSNDPTLNFQVRLVIAISMQKLDRQYAGLADSYYLAALPFLNDAVHRKDVSSLQCFALIAQYSLLTPTRTAAYWVVGLAAKMCQELGLCDEQTIDKPPSGIPPNVLEVDMRRRMFWIITSMEYGLSHSLGRPSAFGVAVDNINVNFFELCDDRFITPDGLLPGHHPIMKKCISVHFLKMRLLQAEIRRTLYLKKRPSPISETDPWFETMFGKIDEWVHNCPKNDEGSGLSEAWFHGRRNTMVIFMLRPSPQIPTPSLSAAQRCFDAAVFNIHLQKQQVAEALIDVTWIFTQAIFMALNTTLWSLSYPGIRQIHSLDEVSGHIEAALSAIDLCADRWPGVNSARQLYSNLIQGCLKAYENDKQGISPGSTSGLEYSPGPSQSAQSPGSTTGTSLYGTQSPRSLPARTSVSNSTTTSAYQRTSELQHTPNLANNQGAFTPGMASQSSVAFSSGSPSVRSHHTPYGSPRFEGQVLQYPFPAMNHALPAWGSITSAPGAAQSVADFSADGQPWLAPFGDVYSPYLGQPYPTQISYQMEMLGEQDQLDLLASLENSSLPEISGLAGDASTYYTAHLP